jgi:adenine-specific DNA-methyltransferase
MNPNKVFPMAPIPATTDFHARFDAEILRQRQSADSSRRLSAAIAGSAVDLNPHQIDAALFALRSPLGHGVVLADEVGLGKTIEAGLVISQCWAERKRRILCIVPANLRKQWQRELVEKFFLPSLIVESRNYRIHGFQRPPSGDGTAEVLVCSHEFAAAKASDVARGGWDLVVIDEAHRLRNVYKRESSARRAHAIRDAITDRRKLLLTATPLQNSLMELYGLITFVDPHAFGSADAFRERYATRGANATDGSLDELKRRIAPYFKRTLRRQVTEYVRFTNRISHTQDFTPTDAETALYEGVSEYLRRDTLQSLPGGQRTLLTLVIRKILASSTFAIAATLGRLVERLERLKAGSAEAADAAEAIVDDTETDLEDALAEFVSDDASGEHGADDPRPTSAALDAEIAELKHYASLAESITVNAKGTALLLALRRGLEKASEIGSPQKALVFTESRRTQVYLRDLLVGNGYAGRVVLFNGSNSDEESRRILGEWLERHRGSDLVTASPTADMRSALVEHFRDRATIMIATESAAEGVNLQFCNLVVNYDLPWNPQRIEQRIGRCHRYGQLHDVVVINFLNRRNDADRRVFELLSSKFELFDGVFGASDRVLGTIDSGIDFERRILEIYQECRTAASITLAFDALQAELEEQVSDRLEHARQSLLEHFDEDVHKALRLRATETALDVEEWQATLWRLVRHEGEDLARWEADGASFTLHTAPTTDTTEPPPLGRYYRAKPPAGDQGHWLWPNHPLARHLIDQAITRPLPCQEVEFSYRAYSRRISVIEPLVGMAGWLSVDKLVLEGASTEDHLLVAAVTDSGEVIDADTARRLFALPGKSIGAVAPPEILRQLLLDTSASLGRRTIETRGAAAADWLGRESDKLDAWAEDLKAGLESDLRTIAAELKVARRATHDSASLPEKLEAQKRVHELSQIQKEKRRRLFEAHDAIDADRERMIAAAETLLRQEASTVRLFTLRWRVT